MEYPSLDKPIAGAFRFNTDSSQLEIYDGNQWTGLLSTSPKQQTGGTRGIISGGGNPGATNIIEYANIDTTGNFADFGDLNNAVVGASGSADRTRGITSGGYSYTDAIDFITIASTGNATDFGNLTVSRGWCAGGSNSTRGLTAGGWGPAPQKDVIDYITIQSTGDAKDFGNLTAARQVDATANSPTRVVFCGGVTGPSPFVVGTTARLDYVTTSTLGEAADFGDLFQETFGNGAASNAVRGLIIGGADTPVAKLNVIQYITIATLGNATDFGDLNFTAYYTAACASSTRAVNFGASTPSVVNQSDYMQIMSTGNATDFGDMTTAKDQATGFSNGHGGL